jgi:hypothetical protein
MHSVKDANACDADKIMINDTDRERCKMEATMQSTNMELRGGVGQPHPEPMVMPQNLDCSPGFSGE